MVRVWKRNGVREPFRVIAEGLRRDFKRVAALMRESVVVVSG